MSRVDMLRFWSDKYCISVNNKRKDETLLLMCLREDESDSCIMRLIKMECDVNATDRDGASPLHFAVKRRQTVMVAIELIKRGANINAQDNKKSTPLHWAVRNQEAMCMLLYYGADVHLRCCENMSPLNIAINYAMFGSIQTLMDYHVDEDLYEEINFYIHKYPDKLPIILLRNPRLFKFAWSYINHDSLMYCIRPFLSIYFSRHNSFSTNERCECLQLILQSDSIIDFIEHFNKYMNPATFVEKLLYNLYAKQIEINKRMGIIFMVLSLGTKIPFDDFNYVFQCYRFGAELEAFIYAADYEIVYNFHGFRFALLPFILALSNDFSTKTIVLLLKKQIMYSFSYVNTFMKQNHNANALRFFSFNSNAKTELLKICGNYISKNCHIKKVLDEIPEVPSLLELSRNRVYLSIRNCHKIKKPYHFHDAVKNLLLPQKLKDVIIFKTPIY